MENIIFTRPIYAGKAFQKKVFNEGKLFATLRPNNFDIQRNRLNRKLFHSSLYIKDLRTIVKEIVRKATGGVDLSEAKSDCIWWTWR